MSSFEVLRRYALTLPGVEEGLHRGGCALRFRGKKFALWWAEGGRAILKLDPGHQHLLFEVRPEIFEPCSVGTGVWSFVNLDALDDDEVHALTREAFATIAPRRLTASLHPLGEETTQLSV